MAKKCEICGKATATGRRVSHAHNVTPRTWEPNLRRVRVAVGGWNRHLRVCARCLRSGKVQKPLVRRWKPADGQPAPGSLGTR